MQSVGVKEAEPPSVLIVSNARKHVSEKNFIAIALVNKNILSWADERSQGFDFRWSNVDGVKLSKLRLNSKGIKRTPRNRLLSSLRKMLSRSSKCIDVHMEETSLLLC